MRCWWFLLPLSLLASCSTPSSPIEERQITSDVGAAQSPVLSRDGTAIAFAAVAQGYTNPQIWVERADGSAPPRPLTNDTSKNYAPEFSPDGRSLYFTSLREPQGIYRVPSFGGTPELVIPNGYSAKISPDGNTILYGYRGQLVRRALAGGDSTPVLPNIANSCAPLWSPDGKNILLTSSTPQQRDPEWWIVPAAGGEPRKTSLGADLRLQGFNYIATNAWLQNDWIVFTGRQGETQTVWKVQLGPDGRPASKAIRATADAEGDFDASSTGGKVVFARTRVDSNIWALPVDPTGEHAKSPPEPLTSSPARKGQPSAAGAKLLYSAETGDRYSLFLKDEGQRKDGDGEKLRDAFFSVLAGDGLRYAYGEGVKEQLNVYLKSRRWWSFWSTTLCESCGMPRQFSPDGHQLLLWLDSPAQQRIDIVDRPCVAQDHAHRIVHETVDRAKFFSRRPLDSLRRPGGHAKLAGIRGSGFGAHARPAGVDSGHDRLQRILLRVLVGLRRLVLHPVLTRTRREFAVFGCLPNRCCKQASPRSSRASIRI
jgi:hypothetical protein